MKKLKLAIVLMIIGFFISSFDIYDDISNAIKTGNSKQVAAYIGKNIDLTIITQEAVYSKVQAEQVLRDFFSKNPPKSFVMLHNGTSKEGNMYMIGNLVTKTGKSFRASLFFRQTGKINLLKELRFETE